MLFRLRIAVLVCAALLLPASVSALTPGKQLQQYGHQTWQNDSGLPQNTVNAVLQTHDGFIWLATEGGLVRFDGTDFLIFNTDNTPELRSNSVRGLMEDDSGTMWVSTGGGLLRLRGGRFSLYSSKEGLPSDSVLSTYSETGNGVVAITAGGAAALRGGRFETIAGTSDFSLAENLAQFEQRGHLWIAGGQEVFEINLATGSLIRSTTVSNIGELQAVAVSSRGELWLGGSRGAEKMGVQNTRYTVREELPSDDVTALLPAKDGGMWAGTNAGLALFSDGHVRVIGKQRGPGGSAVEKLAVDRAGALWVGTSKGIARVGNELQVMTLERPWLARVLAIVEDREGNMWFGTDTAGVSILRDQAFYTVTTTDGLSADLVRTIFQDHAGNIWLGTNGGGLDEIVAGAATAVRYGGQLSSNVVMSLAETGDGLWVGTPGGLDRIQNGRVKVFTASNGLADDFVRSLYADRDGSLWIGTRHGLSHFVHGKFTSYSTMDGMGSDLIGAILRTRRGDLWVGTLGGLSRLAGDRFVNDAIGGTGAGRAVTSLLEDAEGTLWIGTHGGGLYRMHNGAFSSLAGATRLPEEIFGMLDDGRGDLWLSSRDGIYRAALAALNDYADKKSTAVTVARFGVTNGMRTSEASSGGHPTAWRMRDGTLWFATVNGAAVVDPAATLRNEVPPRTVIEQVLVDERPVEFDPLAAAPEVTVPPGHHQLAIRYAGLSFTAPQQVEYRYMMEGFDPAMIEAHGRRTAYYTNLPPGKYRFLVLSANSDGVWNNQAAHLLLSMEPHFVQTKWFYLLMALAVMAAGYGLYRWRVVYVESKYSAVLAERGRIAREIHDTLAQGYVAVSVQLELATRLLKTSREAALEPLERSKELVREGLAEARSSIWNLRSQAEAETLPAVLAGMVDRGNHDGASTPMLKLEVKGTYRPLSREDEAQLVRIVQEAVANARRHADATHIWIALIYDEETLVLRIADDGRGFENAQERFVAEGHFGLQGMRERANAIRARLNFGAREDGGEASPGTVVMVELELKNPNRRSTG